MRIIATLGLLAVFTPLALRGQVNLPNGSADLGAQINAAAAALPANGGKILVQAQANGQCYVFSVPIVINTAVIIQGQGSATCLNYAGSGTAITFAGGGSSYSPAGSYPDGAGLRDLLLLGSGSSGGQTGLLLGGAQNLVGFYATEVTISNFGLGLQFGRGVWNFKMEHSAFAMNGQNVHWGSSIQFGGENLEFDGVTFVGTTFTNSVELDDNNNSQFSNLNNLTMVSCNFDNAQLVINNGAGGIRLYSPHFENPGGSSGTEPFVRISAYTAGTDVVLDGPDFYNDQNNPYPSSFIEIDGGPTVLINQMRSINFDATMNVPTNVYINGWATVTLVGNAPLRAAKTQYTIAAGSTPTVQNIADQGGTPPPPPPLTVFDASGAQIQNAHITTGKVILPGSGTATVGFQGASAFTQTPACTVSYQTGAALNQPQTPSFNPFANQITIFGQQYIGVYFTCIGN